MRLILNDRLTERSNFHPLTLCRPTWELRCGMTTLGEKLAAAAGTGQVACFVPDYLAESYRGKPPGRSTTRRACGTTTC